MMTRKNFEEIAKVLDANFTPLETVLDFADMLEEDNPRFNRYLFVQAATGQIHERANRLLKALDRETVV